jgi:glycosyltransferase involved in cell wall biosynthesis
MNKEIAQMNLVYVDAGLRSNLGHHANSCRHIVKEMRARNIPTAVLASSDVEESLRSELAAIPWFRCQTYGRYDQDPVCGWMINFELVARVTREDMTCLAGLGAEDLVYVNSIQPPQFMAMIMWLKSIPEDQRPTVIMEFGTDPGVNIRTTPDGVVWETRDPRIDARATLHRYAARQLNEADRRWLRLATFDSQSSAIFESLLGAPVGVLPLPHRAVTSCRERVGKRPITISVLGHQRLEKGFDLAPGLARRLLKSRDDIRILIHNGAPDELTALQQELRSLAETDSRLVLNEDVADARLWAELLDQSDLIVCPYNIHRFISSYSAVATEAIANAIPLVVPAGTTLAVVMAEFGNPGATFTENTVDSVFAATETALGQFDHLAAVAKAASRRWEQTRGAPRLADTLLSWRGRA